MMNWLIKIIKRGIKIIIYIVGYIALISLTFAIVPHLFYAVAIPLFSGSDDESWGMFSACIVMFQICPFILSTVLFWIVVFYIEIDLKQPTEE